MKILIVFEKKFRKSPILLGLSFFCFFSCSRPVAKFTYSGNSEAPASISFENLSEKAVGYEWDFGDGSGVITENAPTHRFRSSGNYLVRLKAINEKNKSKTFEQRLQITAPDRCLVELETELGVMILELFDATPKHQENFTKLVENGYFDGLLFHRVIDGFMVQGGDPESRNAKKEQPLGRGGPGYTVPAEFVDSLVHIRGALAAARLGDSANPQKQSSGSQFYIVQGRPVNDQMLDEIESGKGFRYSQKIREQYLQEGGTPFLDRDYTVFGRVISGFEVIDAIAKSPKDPRDRPLNDIKMTMKLIK